ncbi:tetratricopeptide repeat protein [Candidatus Dependentiae bacterium]|nr:tetratricopeptide repeat protein [Candidatus Dependentiae bacterium]
MNNFAYSLITDFGDKKYLHKLIAISSIKTKKDLLKFLLLNTATLKSSKITASEIFTHRIAASKIADKIPNAYIKTYAKLLNIYGLLREGKLSKAYTLINKEKNHITEFKNNFLTAYLLELEGDYYSIPKDRKAIDSFKKALKKYGSIANEKDIYRVKSNLLAAYLYKKDIKNSEMLIKELLSSPFEKQNLYFRSKLYNNLGILYYYKNKFKESKKYFLKSFKLSKKLNQLESQQRTLGNVAAIYTTENNYLKAIEIYKQLLTQFTSGNYFLNIFPWLINIGHSYYNLNKYKEAKIYFNKYINYAVKYSFPKRIIEGHYYKARIYFYQNNLKLFLQEKRIIKKYLRKQKDSKSEYNYLIILDLFLEILSSPKNNHNKIFAEYKTILSKRKNISLSEWNDFNSAKNRD